jgi:penicillin-binding protein-related factor A (putative recombinase)
MDRQSRDRQQWQNAVNNAQGHSFEDYIKAACITYQAQGRAEIKKTPEPFRVTAKHPDGTFTGRFTALAQPDFQGTLTGGRSIVLEAKYTITDRLKRNILTAEQMAALEHHRGLGAVAGICAGIKDLFYFIPWEVWREMKRIFGRQYITAAEAEPYRVRFTGAVMFLDYIHKQEDFRLECETKTDWRAEDEEKIHQKDNQGNITNSLQFRKTSGNGRHQKPRKSG